MSDKFKTWYDANKDALNARRRERYHADPALRKAAQDRQRNYRRDRKGVGTSAPQSQGSGAPYRISEAAELVGRSAQTLRLWEAQGLVPPFPAGTHRRYTPNQVQLLGELRDTLALATTTPPEEYKARVEEMKIYLFNRWTID